MKMHEEKIPKILAALHIRNNSFKEYCFFCDLVRSINYQVTYLSGSNDIKVLDYTNDRCYIYSVHDLNHWDFHS